MTPRRADPPPPRIRGGWRVTLRMLAVAARLRRRAWRHTGSLRTGLALAARLEALRRVVSDARRPARMVESRGRTYFGLAAPGVPSPAWDAYIEREFAYDRGSRDAGLQVAILSITRRCDYRCEHCFEADLLAAHDTLTLEDLRSIVGALQRYGVSQLQIGGGEPLRRLDAALDLARGAAPGTDFWLLTSGSGLTPETAAALRDAGYTGVDVSIDHWDADEHGRFRRHPGAFAAACDAVRNARTAGLLTAITVCATRAFVREEHLVRYMALARSLGTCFVQFLEARPAGAYAGRDVRLTPAHHELLRAFTRRHNADARSTDPIIQYMAAYQRSLGCLGAGTRYLFIDGAGEVHACPFCRGSAGSLLTEELPVLISRLQRRGCDIHPHIPLDGLPLLAHHPARATTTRGIPA